MEKPTSIQDFKEIKEADYRKPIMIGSVILVAYFIMFWYKALSSWFRSELHVKLFGYHTTNYLENEIIISSICIFLGICGLYFFASGLRKMRRSIKTKESRNLHFLIIIFLIVMLIANLFFFTELVYYILEFYINLPEDVGWKVVSVSLVYSEAIFASVIILVLIQNYFIRNSKLLDETIVSRPISHFFLLGAFIVWIFFSLNNYLLIIIVPSFYHLPSIICQLVTSLLAAGVYLELVIKLRNQNKRLTPKTKRKKIKEVNNNY